MIRRPGARPSPPVRACGAALWFWQALIDSLLPAPSAHCHQCTADAHRRNWIFGAELPIPRRKRRRLLAKPDVGTHTASMRLIQNFAAILLLVVGGTFFLQGINVIPGSFMTGQTKWALYGGSLLIVGVVLLIGANRRRP